MTAFDPRPHITQLKGKDYLEVKWRLVWFRDEHPDWGIHSEVIQFDAQMALVKATITNENGLVMAQGHKQEEPKHFADFLEKAETGAIGRALGVLGYGTQFAPEFDEGERIVDSPVSKPAAAPKPAAQPTRAPAAPAPAAKPASEARKSLLARCTQIAAHARELGFQPPEVIPSKSTDAQLEEWYDFVAAKVQELTAAKEPVNA